MALELIILMRANPLLRLLEVVGPENRNFFEWYEVNMHTLYREGRGRGGTK
jgi:hypothetical protein